MQALWIQCQWRYAPIVLTIKILSILYIWVLKTRGWETGKIIRCSCRPLIISMLGRYRFACFFLKASHALLEETLNAKKYPLITFKSQGIIKKDNQFEATGKLALRGTTKIITRPFTGNKSTVIFNGTSPSILMTMIPPGRIHRSKSMLS